MKLLIISIIFGFFSQVAFATDITGMKSADESILSCDLIKYKLDQYIIDMTFVRCLDICYSARDNHPDGPQCHSTPDGNFKEQCMFVLWGYVQSVEKEYMDCVNKSQQGIN
jgi:hypothetical protein